MKVAFVAEGSADFYITGSKHIKTWDTCAGDAIIRAAGGSMKNIFGNNLSYNDSASHNTPIYAATPQSEQHIKLLLPKALNKWQDNK